MNHLTRRSQLRSVRLAAYSAAQRCIEPLEKRVLLTGTVFVTTLHDLNGNGVKDPDEPGLQGWTVFVDYDRDGALQPTEPSQLTDIDGEAFISGVPQGTWDIREVLPAGWTPSPGFSDVDRQHVADNEQTDILFLNKTIAATGDLQGTVWNDVNGDGVRDAGDAGLPGWSIYLDLNNDNTLDAGEPNRLSDANGSYSFTSLTPGQYKVREITPPAWEPTIGYDRGNTVDIAAGQVSVSDFGNFSLASVGAISGTVWNDVNADGVRAPGDPGMSGWTVFLDINADGSLSAGEPSALTDPMGVYSFPSVIAGTYLVTEIVQPGWFVSTGSAAVNVTVVGENTSTLHFGNYTPTLGSISGKVWNDLNADGSSAGEPGLPGWTVFIDQNSDGVSNPGEPSAVTNGLGNYALSGVPVGANVVREITPIGWQPTAPGTGMQLVDVPNATTVVGINFGNLQHTDGSIRGVAYSDTNRNHVRDAGERGLAGITIFLDLDDDQVLDPTEPKTLTSEDLFYTPAIDEAGTYSFTHLLAGTYHVRQIVPALLSATLEADRSVNVNLLPGEDRANVNFANRFRANELHGTKYNDLNANHQRDAGEPGIGGVTIYLDVNRNNALDVTEPRTLTAADGSYAFVTDLNPGAYVVREVVPAGWSHTYPTTVGGTLWPPGVSNPAVGNVSPTSITASLAEYQSLRQNVSLTLPLTGPLTDKVDVFLLFDDTGSFINNSPIVRAAFPQIISTLQASLPGIDLAFGVGRFEEYANFAAEYGTGRPFVLNQPIIAATTPGFSASIQAALDRTAPGYGGDEPETDIEALFQTVTGRGFDGNNNGTTTDSGAAGPVATQLSPGNSGDVPSFASFTIDAAGNVLPASGGLGGAGFRAGALPIILTATDTGFAFQPRGETSITGINGLTLPISAFTQTSRPTTPFNSGAGIQETITALNALGALVVGLGTNPQATIDPRQGLESLARLTGAINRSTATIANGTIDPIAPGDPLYFEITTGFGASVANGVVTAIQNAVSNVNVNITLKASDPRVHILSTPGAANNVGAGQTAAFDVEFTGDGRPHRFDLQFVRQGTDVVLGSIPVVLGTPIDGDGYEFEDLEEGEIDDTVDFGNVQLNAPLTIATSFAYLTQQALTLDFNQFVADSLSLSDLDVINLTTNTPAALQSLSYDPATNRATVHFTQPIIADGNYQVRIAAGAITNLTAPLTFDFFVLSGDANRDRHVDSLDQAILIANLGQSGNFSQGDFDYSGTVDSADQALLTSNLYMWLPPQGALALPATSGDDVYRVRLESPTTMDVFSGENTTPTFRIPLGAFTSLSFAGGAGNDVFTVDFSNGNPIPGGGVSFDGGADSDTLGVIGTISADTVTLDLASATFNAMTIAAISVEGATFDGKGGFDTVSVNANQHVIFTARQHLESLTVAPGATVSLPGGGDKPIVTRALSLDNTALLDLADNSLILDYTGPSQLAMIQSAINSARKNGLWNGKGITSIAAHDNPLHNTTLAAMESIDFKSIYGDAALFASEPIDATAVLVKYTYYGDADFNGAVNFDDYSRLDNGFSTGRTGWLNGDFDGSGVVNFDDYSLIDLAFNTQVSALRPGGNELGGKALNGRGLAAR